ncbi:MAG: nitroreductase [Thermodesulfobacteriota bacterium]
MQINRRNFLKQSLFAGVGAMSAGSLISACSSITRQDLQSSSSAGPPLLGLEKKHLSILHYASLAPSGHNTQPWGVRIVSPQEWIIAADSSRQLPAVDPHNRELLLSLGTFTENLVLAASHFGFKAEVEVIARSPFEQDIVKIRLHRSTPDEYPLQKLSMRRTVKHGYLNKEINAQDVRALAEPFADQLFYFPRGSEHADCIMQGAMENFKKQTYRQEAQAELVRWLRLSNADAEKHRDGLTVSGMEIQGIKGWYVRSFTKPADFLKPAFLKQSIDLTAKLAREGAGWLVITSQGDSVADLIETGRRFERMALMARERMLALHPMTQSLEEKSGIRQIAAEHDADIHPQFILRVGYLDRYPDPVTLRRPVSWFVAS